MHSTAPNSDPDFHKYFEVIVKPISSTSIMNKRKVILCNNYGDVECNSQSHVDTGDVLLVTMDASDYLYVAYINKSAKRTEGWIARDRVEKAPADRADISGWLGHWADDADDITITPSHNRGFVLAKGYATYGAQDPEIDRRGGINTGEFAAKFMPEGGFAAFAVGDENDPELGYKFKDDKGNIQKTIKYGGKKIHICKIKLRKLSTYLIVNDNGFCGGNNVTFSGYYRKMG
jgi:hypothetical protein